MKPYLPWLNLVSVMGALAVNFLSNALPLNGRTTASISDQFPTLFVPAGYVFAIWGVIYLGWIAFAVYQALPAQRVHSRLQRIGWLFGLANLANAAWLFAWHYEQVFLSVLIMLALLLLLGTIYRRLDIGRARVAARERWFVDLPFSLYLGWISVATIANVSVWLYSYRWDGWGLRPEFWAIVMLGVALGVGLVMALARAEVVFLLVLAWAFVGIAVKQAATPSVANAALLAAAVALLLIPLGWLYRRRMAWGK